MHLFLWHTRIGVNGLGGGGLHLYSLRGPLPPLPPHLTLSPSCSPSLEHMQKGRPGLAASPGGARWFPRCGGTPKTCAIQRAALLAAAPSWRFWPRCTVWGSPGRVSQWGEPRAGLSLPATQPVTGPRSPQCPDTWSALGGERLGDGSFPGLLDNCIIPSAGWGRCPVSTPSVM